MGQKTNLGHVAHITVDEKAKVGEVDVGGAGQVKIVKPPDVKLLPKRQSTEVIK